MKPTQEDFAMVFEPLERFYARCSELSRDGPASGSRAARDGRTKLGRMSWDLGLSACSVGVDHLVAWQMLRLGAGWQPNFAQWTLVRGAIEGAAIARWLCDPNIGAGERIQRGAGARLADYKERLAFENEMGARLANPKGKARTAEQRIAAFERLLGKTKPIQMPRATELFARYALTDANDPFSGATLFRHISGTAHSKVWSLFQMSTLGEKVELAGGRLAVKVGADEDLVLRATVLAMHVAAEALADIERYGAKP